MIMFAEGFVFDGKISSHGWTTLLQNEHMVLQCQALNDLLFEADELANAFVLKETAPISHNEGRRKGSLWWLFIHQFLTDFS